jgi:hypothetical protein
MNTARALLSCSFFVLAALATWFTVASVADAVQWTAPGSCPDDADVEARIAAIVDAPDAIAPTIADVTELDGMFAVELTSTIDGETQRRTLTAPNCETLAEAAAAVIAITIDPVDDAASVDPSSETVPPVAVAPTVDRTPAARERTGTRGVPPPPPEGARPERRPLQIGLVFEGGYASAIVPRGGGLVGSGVSLGRRLISLEVGARVWTPRSFSADGESFGARVLMATAMATGCVRPPSRRIEVPLCVGFEAGGERVRPLELLDARPTTYPWLAPLLRLGLRLPVTALVGVVLRGEVAVPLVRATTRVEDFGVLWQTQALSARATAGLEFRWIR